MRKIQTPILVTAAKAKVEGKKAVRIIDGSRFTGATVFAAKPNKIEATFTSDVDYLDITLDNQGFKGAVKCAGLGLAIPDCMARWQARGKYTYRLDLPARAQGKVMFETPGGAGQLLIYLIAGFER